MRRYGVEYVYVGRLEGFTIPAPVWRSSRTVWKTTWTGSTRTDK